MSLTDEKLQKFENAVSKEADAEIEKILQEIATQRDLALSDTMNAELTRHFEQMQNQILQIKQSCIKRVSLESQNAKKKLLLARENIRLRVFDAVKDRLHSFTKTPEYKDYLKNKFDSAKAYQADDLVIYVSEHDLPLAQTVFEGMEIKKDNKIQIGGFILKSDNKGFALDETLDTLLDSQQEYFNKISNLTL